MAVKKITTESASKPKPLRRFQGGEEVGTTAQTYTGLNNPEPAPNEPPKTRRAKTYVPYSGPIFKKPDETAHREVVQSALRQKREWKLAETETIVASLADVSGLPKQYDLGRGNYALISAGELYQNRCGCYNVRFNYVIEHRPQDGSPKSDSKLIARGYADFPVNMGKDEHRSKLRAKINSYMGRLALSTGEETLYDLDRRMGGHHKKHKRSRRHHYSWPSA